MQVEVTKVEFLVGSEVAWRLESMATGEQATANVLSLSEQPNPLVTEGVRRAVSEYGEVMRKLSNE